MRAYLMFLTHNLGQQYNVQNLSQRTSSNFTETMSYTLIAFKGYYKKFVELYEVFTFWYP